MQQKETESFVNVLKGIAILAVIIGHTHVPDWLARYIYSFHIPIFFVISGYLFDADKWKGNFRRLCKKRARTYLLPYFCIASLIIISNMVEYVIIDGRPDSWNYFFLQVQGLFFSKALSEYMVNFVPMWFLPCIFLCSMMFYGLMASRLFYGREKIQFAVIIIMIVVNCIVIGADLPQLPWQIDTALFAIPFMYLGNKMKKYKWDSQQRAAVPLLIIGFIFGVINPGYVHFLFNRYGNILFMFIGAISTILALFWIAENCIKTNRFLEFWGCNTIIIIGMDYYVDHILGRVITSYGIDYYSSRYNLFRIIEIIIILAVMVEVYLLIKKKLKQNKERNK